MLTLSLILFIGFILDLLIGDPRYGCHPVRVMGRSIALVEGFLRRHGLKGKGGGTVLVLVIEIMTVMIYIVLSKALGLIHFLAGWCFDLYIFYSCIALKDLIVHVRPVITSLDSGNLQGARAAVAGVVGRDVDSLDREGVIRAAIETLSENFVDGFFTPVFWLLAGAVSGGLLGFDPVVSGLGLMLMAKTASTLDSMVGYKNDEYFRFGWAGARLDDLVNFLPARLSLLVLFLGAWVSGLRPVKGFKVALRDRLKHDSPNSAHAESFDAGALDIRLGGPTMYRGIMKNKPWLGEGNRDPVTAHIGMTWRLIKTSGWISVIISLALMLWF